MITGCAKWLLLMIHKCANKLIWLMVSYMLTGHSFHAYWTVLSCYPGIFCMLIGHSFHANWTFFFFHAHRIHTLFHVRCLLLCVMWPVKKWQGLRLDCSVCQYYFYDVLNVLNECCVLHLWFGKVRIIMLGVLCRTMVCFERDRMKKFARKSFVNFILYCIWAWNS